MLYEHFLAVFEYNKGLIKQRYDRRKISHKKFYRLDGKMWEWYVWAREVLPQEREDEWWVD